ncbi:MAG: tRNA-intron lyase [Candidatus Aenigmarchaeota archaeon]|nr:tRNA-intron lyase [Candidatus Aenigmarchaeota archaeon]
MVKAELINDAVFIYDDSEAQSIFNSGWYGIIGAGKLELALIEAALLCERQRIEIVQNGKNISLDKFFKYCSKLDKRFNVRYAVYRDLRERGLPVRTGLKFGCDFRVYERGVKPLKKGPKEEVEHTKWVVFAVSEDYACSFHELARSVRLAHNIRANMLWAVVDSDKNVTYYEIKYLRV